MLGALLTFFIRRRAAATAVRSKQQQQKQQDHRGLDPTNDEEVALHPYALQATSSTKLDHNSDNAKDAADFLFSDNAVVVGGGGSSGGTYGGYEQGQTNAVLRDQRGAASTVVYVPA